jgi:hypothetical protein
MFLFGVCSLNLSARNEHMVEKHENGMTIIKKCETGFTNAFVY